VAYEVSIAIKPLACLAIFARNSLFHAIALIIGGLSLHVLQVLRG